MSVGARLRASREARGLSIDAVAHATRVQSRILAAIERDDVAAVPPRPFGRGFVRAYAQEMGLDADQTARDYFAQFAPVAAPPAPEPEPEPSLFDRRALAWSIAVVLLGLLAGIGLAIAMRRPAAPAASRPGQTPLPEPSPVAAGPDYRALRHGRRQQALHLGDQRVRQARLLEKHMAAALVRIGDVGGKDRRRHHDDL
jgi:cytoskeleton protein RodZ